MKKHTEKPPIDDLFARKLGNTSLPTSPDGFARLQARMQQGKPEARIVLWRNPGIQRYMAAACLVLVGLFGWLYWPSGEKMTADKPEVAFNQAEPLRPQNVGEKQPGQLPVNVTPAKTDPVVTNQETLAKVEKHLGTATGNKESSVQPVNEKRLVRPIEIPKQNEPVLAQTKAVETNAKSDAVPNIDVTPVSQSASEQVALVENKTTIKPTPATERVLVVTIDEPAALVAARQAAKASLEEKPVGAINEQPEKEAKTGRLWQQVKRIKQGDLFARRDNANNDERGLLSRAYDGLKHSLDKDKSAKQ